MEWLNDGVGLIVVISSTIIILLLAVLLCLIFVLRNKIAVQRLNFLGYYSTDVHSRARFAECSIGNRSLNEVALAKLGIRNGKSSYDLTELYKHKANLNSDARIVIEQRGSLVFSLTQEELLAVLNDGNKGKELKTLWLYAIDLTGNLYKGKVRSVRRLLFELMRETYGTQRSSAPVPAVRLPAPAPEPVPAPLPPVENIAPQPVFPPVTEQRPAPDDEPRTLPAETEENG